MYIFFHNLYALTLVVLWLVVVISLWKTKDCRKMQENVT